MPVSTELVPAHYHDQAYLETMLGPIRVCARYRPKLGQGGRRNVADAESGVTAEQFLALYGADPFYHWIGLDNPLMYAAHKAAGGMTSIYRQIGIGSERLFKSVLKDRLGLSSEDVAWSYPIARDSGKEATFSLDGRIPISSISDEGKRATVQAWLQQAAVQAGVEQTVINAFTGIVFEVRQGYKSKDSKRQNADIANAAMALKKGLFPCVLIMSAQIDQDLVDRYRNGGWAILTGTEERNDPIRSTYDFVREVVGYDLAGFFKRNSDTLRIEMAKVLKALLEAKTT